MIFLVETLSLAYKSPEMSYDSCSASKLCVSFVENKCGKQPSGFDYSSEFYKCQSEVVSSEGYLQCTQNAQKTQETCQKDLSNQLQTYQIVSFLLYGLIGILFIIVGFLVLGYRSIGSGLLLGGVFVILFSGYISIFSAIASTGSIFSRLLGGSAGISPDTFSIMRVILYFVVAALLIVLTYIRLDKPGLKGEED